MKIGLLKVRSFYVRSNGIGLLTLGQIKLGLLGGHRLAYAVKIFTFNTCTGIFCFLRLKLVGILVLGF
jgi:hypothetical protein